MLRNFVQGLALVGVVIGTGALGAGCLDRPVTTASPTIKTNFTSAVNQSGIDKVDILFDIDNSASMGDKQAYLIQAIPQMIARLVTPQCIDEKTSQPTGANADPTTGQCATGSAPEFAAVHDMHIGVVTSSLGPRLGVASAGPPASYVCDPGLTVTSTSGTTVSAFNDDQGHLINRTTPFGSGAALADGTLPEGGGFLYWFPALGNAGKTPVTPPATITQIGAAGTAGSLVGDFTEIVGGAGESGCGIESQLESWYRFLIQPDPYASLQLVGGKATWSGVDTTILQQRHDFLRPDSLVAVIVLTDENDSEIDVRSYQGSGYLFMSNTYSPPRATSACALNPNDPKCTTCSSGNPDPACAVNGGVYSSSNDGNDWGYNLNLRHVHMQQKYALNPQFPLTRYYNGLTSPTVPNRVGEYPDPTKGYAGTNNCTNPLFAATLPTAADAPDAAQATPASINTALCKLPGGAIRTAADVFYAHIGGVPHQLLQSKPGDGTCAANTAAADCPQKDSLSGADWTAILGQGPAGYTGAGGNINFDYTGIDPHMIESMTPRNTMTNPPASNPAVTTLAAAAFTAGGNPAPDPINGREWTTNAGIHSLPVDREYACIFQLPVSSQRDCAALKSDTIEGNSCDCVPGGSWSTGGAAAATNNSTDQIPPLCATASTDGSIKSAVSDYTVQTYAKAYPTVRELMLANMMGAQGIVSSLCPIHPNDNATGDDPLYGYRPAVNAIVNRLKSALGSQCVPKLTPDSTGNVPCLILVSFAKGTGPASSTACASYTGGAYDNVDPTVLAQFNQQQAALAGDAGGGANLANDVTCSLKQIPEPAGTTCVGTSAPGWCYVTGAGVSGGSTCSQQISYSSNSVVPNGATINLQCISTNEKASDGGTAAAATTGSGS